jgi:hypothetical protein
VHVTPTLVAELLARERIAPRILHENANPPA